MRWGQVEREEERSSIHLAWGGFLFPAFRELLEKGLSEANKRLQTGVGVPGPWRGKEGGHKISFLIWPLPFRSFKLESGRAGRGSPPFSPSSTSLAVHHTSSSLSQPGHAHDGPIPRGSPPHPHTPANKGAGHLSPPAVPTPGQRGRGSYLQPLFPAR